MLNKFSLKFQYMLEETHHQEEIHQMAHEFIELEPDELKPHPVNDAIYGEIDVDQSLIDSIQRKGQLEPIIINQNNIIISGQRRWLAIKQINDKKFPQITVDEEKNTELTGDYIHLKAKCQRICFVNELQEKMAIIEYNRRRQKRYSQLYNEIEMLHQIWDPIAEAKRLANLKTYDVTTLSHRLKKAIKENKIPQNQIDPEQTDEENAINFKEELGGAYDKNYAFQIEENFETSEDRVRERIAKALGLGFMAVGRITKIGRLAKDQQNKTAIEAMQKLDRGELSLNGAYIICKLEQERLDSVLKNDTPHRNPRVYRVTGQLLDDIEKKEKTPAKAWKEYEAKKAALDDDVYSVILIEPHIDGSDKMVVLNENLKRLRSLSIPAAPDAAIFVIANVNTLKICIELLTYWWQQFKIQSFTPVVAKQNECGDWFNSGYDILLLATRGSWYAPIPENRFTGDAINRDELHSVIQKMYPNIYSFYELTEQELERLAQQRSTGKPIPMTKQHEDWGEPLFLAPTLDPEPGVGSYTEPTPTPEAAQKKDASSFQSPVMGGQW